MRPRTFILIIVVLLLLAAAAVLVFFYTSDGGVADLVPGLGGAEEATPVAQEPGAPSPTATPAVNYVPVVVARLNMPAGTVIQEDFLQVEMRPDDNIAVQAGYIFSEPEAVVGRLTRVKIGKGQEVLDSMIALSPLDLASMGSDLALYVNQGNVALAFPINRYSGAAFAMRPGDLVDVLATMSFIDIDPEFRSALPNFQRLVDQQLLSDGGDFLLPEGVEGRLELIPGINLVATIGPQGATEWGGSDEALLQLPRRVTQLTIQQAEVIWVGTWEPPGEMEPGPQVAPTPAAEAQPAVEPTPTPVFERSDLNPDVVILSMPLQDALSLKWAMDRGLTLDLALRSQGDNSVFVTTDVSLPQLVEQGGLTIPETTEFDLSPRADEVPPPSLAP